MKNKLFGIVFTLAVTAALLLSLTCVSFAEAPATPSNLKVRPYYNRFVLAGAHDDYSYYLVLDENEDSPSSIDGVPYYEPFEGTLGIGYGVVVPNKTYYIHVCCKSDDESEETSDWYTYKVKSAKVPKPTSVKAVAGKGSMTVKWKSAGDSDFKFKVTYSAKGVKAKTVTVKVNEKNYKSPSVKIKKLKKGKKYTVKVQAVTYDGYKSDWSKSATSQKIK